MNIYTNADYKKRDYGCTQVIACVAPALEDVQKVSKINFQLCESTDISRLEKLYAQGKVTFYGYL